MFVLEDHSHPVPRTALRGLRRQLTILGHAIIAWARSPGCMSKLVLSGLVLALVAWPIIKAGGWKHGAMFTAVWLLVGCWKAYRELSPKNMQLLQTNYLARKLLLFRLIRDLENASSLSPPEVSRFQQEALHLIAMYVRDHRADMKCTNIFASLLVEDGDYMRVVARDQRHDREGSTGLHPKRQTLAWVALQTGEPRLTGDVYADYPETAPGKPYKSILVMPVTRGTRVLGVVSVDSTRRYHFDREMKNLVEYLKPYTALLAWTIEAPWATVAKASRDSGVGST